MRNHIIYTDNNFENPLRDKILFEGTPYFLNLSTFSQEEKSKLSKHPILSRHIKHLPKNDFGELRIDNYVGWFNFGGIEYEIRSPKLLDSSHGNEQVKFLINDIAEILNHVNFKFDSPTTSYRETNFDEYSTFLEKFDYYRKIIFELPEGKSISSIIQYILRNPSSSLKGEYNLKDVDKVRKVSFRSFDQLFKGKSKFTELSDTSQIRDTNVAQLIKDKTKKSIFPEKIISSKSFISYDTPENQFVKYFIQEIRTVAYIIRSKEVNKYIQQEADRVIEWSEFILNNTFFDSISKMSFMPKSSSILTYSPGYRQLFDHFINSRFSFRSILEHIEKKYMTHGLNDIASLYEVWTYFKVCKAVLSEEMYLTETRQLSKDGKLKFGFRMENKSGRTVHYNRSFSRQRKDSYSLLFRPDITIEINQSIENRIVCLDAKYKFEKIDSEEDEEPISRVKASDIHKMHCYVDAINNCDLSMVIYPGDRFVFYGKEKPFNKNLYVNDINSFKGVGALNLTPEMGEETLNSFIQKILNY